MLRLFALILTIIPFSISSAEDSKVHIRNSISSEFESKTLDRTYEIKIKLPKNYDSSIDKTYPVLYVQDAPYTFGVAASTTHFSPLDNTIVVAIGFAQGENGQFSRVRDLTPQVDESWTKYETGGAGKYFKFISTELIPYIETQYRADGDRRIFAGQSLGASFGAWILLTEPDLFSGYILTSPSFWFKNDVIFQYEQEFRADNDRLKAKVYMATGSFETIEFGMTHDMVGGQLRFVKQLRSRDYTDLLLKDEIIDGTDHSTTFPVGLAKGLNWLLVDR